MKKLAFSLAAVVLGLLVTARSPAQERKKSEQDGSDPGTLAKKWDFVIMREVRLTRPSGWQYLMPWMVSSPAIGDLSGTLDLEVVTGTEEGSHDFQPLGEGVGRYVGLGSDGRFLWQYNTDNSAGRASPGIADVDGDGNQEVIGGSTSGWMIHLINPQGKRLWRFPCPLRGNFLAAPAAGDLDGQPGLEIVGVTLWGVVYCVQASGKQLWSFSFGGGNSNFHWQSCAVASPVISDANDDGAPDVVVILTKTSVADRQNAVSWSPVVTCLDGRTGKALWATEFQAAEERKRNMQPSSYSSPAVVPMLDGCMTFMEEKQRTSGTRIIAAVNNSLYCLEGRTGAIVWSFDAKQMITSSPAVGDVDGDGGLEAVLGTVGGQIYAIDVSSGQSKWTGRVGGAVYSSPALARKEGGAAFRKEWPMFRHDPARTGFYGHVVGPLDIYFCCDDGGVYLMSGRDGRVVDKYGIKFPPLIAPAGAPHEGRPSLPFVSSPSVADLDGDGRVEIVLSAIDRVWCLTNRASGRNDVAAGGDDKMKPGSPIAAARFVRRDHVPGFSSFLWAQIIHRGDWGPDERTYPAALAELAKRVNLDTVSAKTNVSLLDKNIAMYPFLYITGHYAPGLSDEEAVNLREHLKRGGFLFADACCGSEKFDISLRQLAVQLFPQSNLERIPLSHELFSCFYKIDRAKYHGVPEGEPFLEGITIDDRLVIVYSKYDLGCAWADPPCSKACKGGDRESSLKLATNIVVYALTK